MIAILFILEHIRAVVGRVISNYQCKNVYNVTINEDQFCILLIGLLNGPCNVRKSYNSASSYFNTSWTSYVQLHALTLRTSELPEVVLSAANFSAQIRIFSHQRK